MLRSAMHHQQQHLFTTAATTTANKLQLPSPPSGRHSQHLSTTSKASLTLAVCCWRPAWCRTPSALQHLPAQRNTRIEPWVRPRRARFSSSTTRLNQRRVCKNRRTNSSGIANPDLHAKSSIPRSIPEKPSKQQRSYKSLQENSARIGGSTGKTFANLRTKRSAQKVVQEARHRCRVPGMLEWGGQVDNAPSNPSQLDTRVVTTARPSQQRIPSSSGSCSMAAHRNHTVQSREAPGSNSLGRVSSTIWVTDGRWADRSKSRDTGTMRQRLPCLRLICPRSTDIEGSLLEDGGRESGLALISSFPSSERPSFQPLGLIYQHGNRNEVLDQQRPATRIFGLNRALHNATGYSIGDSLPSPPMPFSKNHLQVDIEGSKSNIATTPMLGHHKPDRRMCNLTASSVDSYRRQRFFGWVGRERSTSLLHHAERDEELRPKRAFGFAITSLDMIPLFPKTQRGEMGEKAVATSGDLLFQSAATPCGGDKDRWRARQQRESRTILYGHYLTNPTCAAWPDSSSSKCSVPAEGYDAAQAHRQKALGVAPNDVDCIPCTSSRDDRLERTMQLAESTFIHKTTQSSLTNIIDLITGLALPVFPNLIFVWNCFLQDCSTGNFQQARIGHLTQPAPVGQENDITVLKMPYSVLQSNTVHWTGLNLKWKLAKQHRIFLNHHQTRLGPRNARRFVPRTQCWTDHRYHSRIAALHYRTENCRNDPNSLVSYWLKVSSEPHFAHATVVGALGDWSSEDLGQVEVAGMELVTDAKRTRLKRDPDGIGILKLHVVS
ncbi:uncharacterized protein MYCFIDRAFT_175077 [Pseudocercospora fijiensis CIRAD86]|uniref:Uncharacterized protein n=1 Tax=Pseudocercospora fijiensis (strain CIRAD86) TaxID=383855 RepID=M2ZXD5_PSEFD|nr:uncharacterized protein MYCFIDRAFT_175077 [Pseudocercospora fijiensis CIRAD86]EME83649.1 hypothetical protein MYCFIDRAFT_175077 [Pseudocercospora fijiensis CIRAD86]